MFPNFFILFLLQWPILLLFLFYKQLWLILLSHRLQKFISRYRILLDNLFSWSLGLFLQIFILNPQVSRNFHTYSCFALAAFYLVNFNEIPLLVSIRLLSLKNLTDSLDHKLNPGLAKQMAYQWILESARLNHLHISIDYHASESNMFKSLKVSIYTYC